jgi:small subunit ribosomal protein S13
MLSISEYRHILRIAGKDIEGSKKIIIALSQIRGLGYNLSQVILQSLNINPNMRIGFLSEKEVSDIEGAIKNPSLMGIPNWYLNRRKDNDTGSDKHLITSDLDFTISNDIEREKTVYSWRGYRHMFGLRVRGQCTRTTGRKGGAVGVKKVVMRPTGGAGAPGSEAKDTGAATPAAESGSPESGAKGSAPKTSENKE